VTDHRYHPASWWAQFADCTERLERATLTDELSDVITPLIPSPLLRREAEIAADVAVLHLSKPDSQEREERARKGVSRLAATLKRLSERSTEDDDGTEETWALLDALEGRWAEAAAAAEPWIGTQPLLKVFVAALRLERFDTALTVRLLRAGQRPEIAIHSGLVVGKYGWWPAWLIEIVTERALAGILDDDFIVALDRCAYAELSPVQAKMARRLLKGDEQLIEASAHRLEGLGEPATAEKLREGDLTAVALAARLIPL
jgi:hypothetical protein